MRKLLIADSSAAFLAALEAALAEQFQIRTCFDGDAALEQLESFQPDVLIINLMLPYRDGLSVLEQTPFHPHIVLAVTPYLNAYVQHAVRELGVDYTMLCPSVKALCLRLQDLVAAGSTEPKTEDPGDATAFRLNLLGFSPHLDGYRQLCAAIPLFARDPGQFMTKELYPAVAKQCGCKSAECVERSIRKAIRTAWSQGDMALWRKYFPPGPRGRIPCPSNKEFICRLSELPDIK